MSKYLDYLPPVVNGVKEYRALSKGLDPETESLREYIRNMQRDQYLSSALDSGIVRREAMLKLAPKATDTLDDRRFRIKSLYNRQPPYTFLALEELMKILCGDSGYTLEWTDSFELKVGVALTSKSAFGEVVDLLEKLTPMNLKLDVSLMYNTYGDLSAYSHDYLSNYTHEQLREEVLE